MSNPEEKATTTKDIDPSSMQRLATFKTPRDLSLGGVKLNKKIYVPNLNVVRNKNKGGSVYTPKDCRRDDKTRRNEHRKNDKNKFVKNEQNITKSAGVFSQGIGRVERYSSRSYYGRDTDSSSALQKPTLRPMDTSKMVSKESEELSWESSVEFTDDFKRVKALNAPIKLPMDDGYYPPLAKPKRTFNVKTEDPIKIEPGQNLSKPEPSDEADGAADMLRREEPTLILVKMPYSLPGQAGSSDDEPRRKKVNGDISSIENNEWGEKQAEVEHRCTLNQMGEGKIGTMRIHRSGRVTLALGDSILDVHSGTKPSFYQELVSVAFNDQSRSATVISLGQMVNKLNVTPQWVPIIQKEQRI